MEVPAESQTETVAWKAYSLFIILDSIPFAFRPLSNILLANTILAPLWILRAYCSDVLMDFAIILTVGGYYNGLSAFKPPEWILETRFMEFQIFAFLVLLMILAGLIVWRGEAPPHKPVSESNDAGNHLLPPLLLPGRTTHTRMFPKRHSFDYSYFSVGVPVGWKGRVGSMLSANLDLLDPSERRRGWFNIDAADYLYRGGPERGLEDRLRHYLRGEGVVDDAWSFAYLVTAPKFLGYQFNPVSFWYIYDGSERLTMMVLEVNNTFGERRLYLLKAEGSASSESLPDGYEAPAKGIKFTNAWAKDFHVSPFNSRKGSYSLTAADPLAALKSGDKIIDNTIVLNSSKSHAKLVARLFSQGHALDPATLSTYQVGKVLKSWFWVGFVTFPRIVAQAYQLYFKRNLHVWFRPEVLASSIGRVHTSSEATLEAYFRGYLSSLVDNAAAPLKLTYIPPGSLGTPVTLNSKHESDTHKEMTLQVLSPAFYTRFAHYAHTSEALDREGLHADPKNRTISITNAEHLSLLLPSASSTTSLLKPGLLDKWRWALLNSLRCAPPEVAYPDTQSAETHVVTDIRSLPSSPFDRFTLALPSETSAGYRDMVCQQLSANRILYGREETNVAGLYRRTLTKVFIANRWFLGFEGLVGLLDLMLRIALVVLWFKLAKNIGGRGGRWELQWEREGWVSLTKGLAWWAVANGVHLWAIVVKGA